jgi:GNAT superfamily N-acetyltransferase
LSAGLVIRPAQPADVELIFALIVELAEYERAAERVTGTVELLAESLFGANPAAEAVIAELEGQPVGFALWFQTFSTWLCRPGLWLEDLYVSPSRRRGGVGHALLQHVARVALQRNCGRLEWSALNWNTPALEFYAARGADQLEEWIVHRLDGAALARVASGDSAGAADRTHEGQP